jgi:hypothetical protein
VSALDSRIDHLYQQPIEDFIATRTALAAELKGDDAKRVKQLKKPTSAPWAVNQVYWHARTDFDRLLKTGAALRRAQVAALEGRSADLRSATQEHREAVAAAVSKAIDLAAQANVQPNRDLLTQTFEALSLASKPPESFGRLTQPLRPGGFEMLTGVDPKPPEKTTRPAKKRDTTAEGRGEHAAGAGSQPSHKQLVAEQRKAAAAARARERELAAAARERETAIKKAQAVLQKAREEETRAEEAWRKAQEDVEQASRALRKLQSTV